MFAENRSFLNPKSQRGAALITALFVITILTILGILVLNTSIMDTKMAANQKVSSKVFYAAEAGLERGLKVLVADMESDGTAGGPWGNLNFPSSAGSVTAAYVNGSTAFDVDVRSMDMYLDGDSTSQVRKLTFTNGGTTLGASTYELYIYSPHNMEVYLMSYASGPNGIAALEYHLNAEDNSPYNNAIFSGTGLNGKVNGNVNVSGSVYSQGYMEFGGTAGITNNYTDGGILAALEAMIPVVTDLDAKIRIKGADLKLKGSAHIGTSNANGAVSDIQVDGDFTSGAPYYADNVGSEVPNLALPGILDGLEAEHPGISSDPTYSGISNVVDRAMAMYKDLILGLNGFAPGGIYADPNASVTTRGVFIAGTETINSSTASFSTQDSLGNGVVYDKTAGTLTFTGIVMFSQDFNISIPVTYASRGAFFDSGGTTVTSANQNEQAALVIAGQEMEFNASFTPGSSSGYLKGGDDTNAIAFIAAKEIKIEGSPGDLVTGMFYTPGEVEFEKQIQVAGTLIAGEFEFEQVPDVFQVPALKNYLPRYMPGTNSILSFKSRKWRRVY